MPRQITRRRLMATAVGTAVLGGLPGAFAVRSALSAVTTVRMTTGLRSARQATAWLGAEAGVFKKHDLDVSFPAIGVGGLQTAAGLMRGDWDFCTTGLLPVAENFLNGGDVVALLRTTAAHDDQFIASKTELTTLAQLAGKRFGVVSDASTGGVGVRARVTLEKAGVTATYVGLGSFENIHTALAKGEIDAGIVPLHLRFAGETQHGWNFFPFTGFEADVPSVFATTRKLVTANRDLVMRVVKANVESIHAFKTQPRVFVPLLQRFLNVSDRKVAEGIYRFYVPLFPRAPRVALAEGMQSMRDAFSTKYPAAPKLQESDISDSSFIDELEKSGFIRRLYTGDTTR